VPKSVRSEGRRPVKKCHVFSLSFFLPVRFVVVDWEKGVEGGGRVGDDE
jgi:hypothetical protein